MRFSQRSAAHRGARVRDSLETRPDHCVIPDAAGSPTVVLAQSHPSSPRALTPFTLTTLPAAIAGSNARGCVTVILWRSGSAAVPYATMYDLTPCSALGVQDNVVAAAV